MKYQPVLFLTCVIWASEREDDNLTDSFYSLSESFPNTESTASGKHAAKTTPVETSDSRERKRSTRSRRFSDAEVMKENTARGRDAKLAPKKEEKRLTEPIFVKETKKHENHGKQMKNEDPMRENEAKAIRKNEEEANKALEKKKFFDYDQNRVSFSSQTPKRCFSWFSSCAKTEAKVEKEIDQVKNVKFAIADDGSEVVVVVCSRDAPAKFDEFIVDLEKNEVKHNYIVNHYGEKDCKMDTRQFVQHARLSNLSIINPNCGKAVHKDYMKRYEEEIWEKFAICQNAKELKDSFEHNTGPYGSFQEGELMKL